jgi:diguanylate cyclase (GGDEF)-like protein/PAS domain S-box-containing protein
MADADSTVAWDVLDVLDEGVLVRDRDGTVTAANDAAARMLRTTRKELLSPRYAFPVAVDELGERVCLVPGDGGDRRAEIALLFSGGDGTATVQGWFAVTTRVLDADADGPRSVLVVLRDLAESRRLDLRFHAIVDQSPDVISVLGTDRRLRFVNRTALQRGGFRLDQVLGRRLEDFPGYAEETIRRWNHGLDEVLATGAMCVFELPLTRGERQVFYEVRMVPELDVDGSVVGIIAVTRDLTERRRAEERSAHQALHDPLTGLANRTLIGQQLARDIARLHREGGVAAVLYIDLDDFKVLNDTMGHEAGDDLLVAVAQRLAGATRPGDVVGRLGGDEFAVVLHARDLLGAMQVADRLLTAVAAPQYVSGRQWSVTASVGLAHTVDPAVSPDALLRDADAAMYEAKAAGGNSLVSFDAAVRDRVVIRRETQRSLRRALDSGELVAHYQPIVDLRTGAVPAVEALARWEHPEHGTLPPKHFITVAEHSELICDLGTFMLDAACRQVMVWERAGRRLRVAVNVGMRHIVDPLLLPTLQRTLDRTGAAADMLTIELTESTVMADVPATMRALGALRGLGIKIAIDDFGTGYSSLSYLRRLPVDVLKVDGSFVRDLTRDTAVRRILASVVEVAKALNLDVVAECVETEEQYEALRELGCDFGQGHLWAPATSAADLVGLLSAPPRGM